MQYWNYIIAYHKYMDQVWGSIGKYCHWCRYIDWDEYVNIMTIFSYISLNIRSKFSMLYTSVKVFCNKNATD